MQKIKKSYQKASSKKISVINPAKIKTGPIKGFFGSRFAQASAISIATILLVLIFQKILPPQIPLFYGLPRGEQQLAKTQALVIPSLLSLTVIIVNYTLSLFIDDDFIKKALVFTSIVSVFFSTITTIKIFFLVGSF